MPQVKRHLVIDIRGVLNWRNNKDLLRLFKSSEGGRLTTQEVRNYLYDKLADGWEVLPFGEPCEGFDKKTGCPGHSV